MISLMDIIQIVIKYQYILINQDMFLQQGEYEVSDDIPGGSYDLQWMSGSGTCTTGHFLSDYGKMSESFGDEDGEIKEYKNKFISSLDQIEITGTLKI